MHLSICQLDQGHGAVVIMRNGRTKYAVHRYPGATVRGVLAGRHQGESLLSWLALAPPSATVDYIEGEDLRDAKSRCIAEIRQLGYWPELKREIARERRTGELTHHRNLSEPTPTFERASKGGVILPGAP